MHQEREKIFISTSSFDLNQSGGDKEFEGHDVVLNPLGRKLTEEEILTFLRKEAPVGLIAGTEPLTRRVLSQSKGLKAISRVGTGLDNVDLDAAKEFSIEVTNTPDAVVPAVAELTLGLILDALRQISNQSHLLKQKKWKKTMGELLRSCHVGVLGLGSIGSEVADLCKRLGAKVSYFDPAVKRKDFPFLPMETLLEQVDIVTLHATTRTQILDSKAISSLKNGAIVVNTSRGNLIDEQALLSALEQSNVAHASLDVYAEEPYDGPLQDLPNVTLTPHIGSYAASARKQMEQESVANLARSLSP